MYRYSYPACVRELEHHIYIYLGFKYYIIKEGGFQMITFDYEGRGLADDYVGNQKYSYFS